MPVPGEHRHNANHITPMLAMHVSADAIAAFRAFANEALVNASQSAHRFYQTPAKACVWIDA
jgi:hypothetical protein